MQAISSKSVGTGIVFGGTPTLDMSDGGDPSHADELEQCPSSKSKGSSPVNRHQNGGQAGESTLFGSAPPVIEESIVGYEDPIMLTQSTHSFLFTEPPCSLPFSFAICILTMSYICLTLALFNNLGESKPDNAFNVPVGVTADVKIAQYFALIIGLIMEEEIPESLYLIRMISTQTMKRKAPTIKFRMFVFCTILRVVMGYLFLFNVFIVTVQSEGVVDIFYGEEHWFHSFYAYILMQYLTLLFRCLGLTVPSANG